MENREETRLRELGCYECNYFKMCDDGDGRVDMWCELGIVGCWEEHEIYLKGCGKWEEIADD